MKTISVITFLIFLTTSIIPPQAAQAQVFNPSTNFLSISPAYHPAVLQGMVIHPEDPLKFDFIVDSGDSGLNSAELKKETARLIRYFIASLATSEKDMWVNLSPYEPDRIVPEAFGQTEMGRDMLAQDYLLKQITSSLMHPEGEVGKRFWDKIYQMAYEKYGATDVPVDTFNKVWIVPQETTVYENSQTNTVFVSKSILDVMLEGDYLAKSASDVKRQDLGVNQADMANAPTADALNEMARNIVREIILPELKREVNEGQNFAPLRQIMNSLILANWYKNALKNSILTQGFANQNKTEGVLVSDPNAKQKIYEQYVQAFQAGAYDILKEDYDPVKQEMVAKKYFSGGVAVKGIHVGLTASIPAINKLNNFAMLQAAFEPTSSSSSGFDSAQLSLRVRAFVALFMLFMAFSTSAQDFKGKIQDVFFAMWVKPLDSVEIFITEPALMEKLFPRQEQDTFLTRDLHGFSHKDDFYKWVNDNTEWSERIKKSLIEQFDQLPEIKKIKPNETFRIFIAAHTYSNGDIRIEVKVIVKKRSNVGGEYLWNGKTTSTHSFANPVQLINWIKRQKWPQAIKDDLITDVQGSQNYIGYKEAEEKLSKEFSFNATVVENRPTLDSFDVTITTQSDRAQLDFAMAGKLYELMQPDEHPSTFYALMLVFVYFGMIGQIPAVEKSQKQGGIDLEKTNVTVENRGEGMIQINFTNDPAMLQKLRNATGLRAIIGDVKPMTFPVLNGLLGLNPTDSDEPDIEQEVAALKES